MTINITVTAIIIIIIIIMLYTADSCQLQLVNTMSKAHVSCCQIISKICEITACQLHTSE